MRERRFAGARLPNDVQQVCRSTAIEGSGCCASIGWEAWGGGGRIGERLRLSLSGWRHRRDFQKLQRFCLFVGRGRSGTTLIGSLLDAHPNACIATELDVLRYVERRYSQRQIFALLRANAEEEAARGNEWTGYQYAVPGQFQGSSERLTVIGDKKAARTLRGLVVGNRERSLDSRPEIPLPDALDRLRGVVGLPLRFVHIVRNPFDQMASTIRHRPGGSLQERARNHLLWAQMFTELRACLPEDEMIDVYHEDVIADPMGQLRRLCGFLGLEASDEYLEACASVVAPAPQRQRDSVEWPADFVAQFERGLAQYDYLARYSFRD